MGNEKLTSAQIYSHGLEGVDMVLDGKMALVLGLSTLAIIIIVFWGRLAQRITNHVRHLLNLNDNPSQQLYWSTDQSRWWPWFKKNILYAPLGKKRHHREIKLSAAMNLGVLPSRFHFVLIIGYYIINIIGCSMIDFHAESNARWAALRGRSGYLAVWNCLALFILMARNNPLIPFLKISYDTFNLFHRWIGRLVVIESVAHTFAWFVVALRAYGLHGLQKRVAGSPFLIYGTLGTVAMVLLAIHSVSCIRHAYWELFLAAHQILAFGMCVGVYVHLKIGTPPALAKFFIGIIVLWCLERSARGFRLIYRNIGPNSWYTQVRVQALAGLEADDESACRVTFQVERPWKNEPGCHVFVYLPSLSMWMSHPFSIAWYDTSATRYHKEEIPMNQSEVDLSLPPRKSNEISLLISTRSGMTKKLFEKAMEAPGGQITLRGFLEGPYGGPMSLKSYGTVLLFAGGAGITYQIPYVRELLAGYELGTTATRKIILVWAIRRREQMMWVGPWMDKILDMPGRREVVSMTMYVTKPRDTREVISASQRVLVYPGRPNTRQIVAHEVKKRVGAMAVSVCGPGAMADDVRDAVRQHVDQANVDFIEESFTW